MSFDMKDEDEKTDDDKLVLARTDISDLEDDWKIVKKQMGTLRNSETVRALIKRAAALIRDGKWPA